MDGVRPRFRGVLLDWRGTLVVAPTYPWLVRRALVAVGRPDDEGAVQRVLRLLRAADATEVESSAVDVDADRHREAYRSWFAAAGIDDELSEALYAAECDVSANPFAHDVGPLLRLLRRHGVRVAVLSDIHVDLRPAFAAREAPGGSWVDLVDAWVLSYEVGLAKPDPAVFQLAVDRLGLTADDVLMVGDRGTHDGAAAEVGVTTLVLPPLRSVEDLRLQRVVDLVLPGEVLVT